MLKSFSLIQRANDVDLSSSGLYIGYQEPKVKALLSLIFTYIILFSE